MSEMPHPQRRTMVELGLSQPTAKRVRVPRQSIALTERKIAMLRARGVPSMTSDGLSRGLWLRVTATNHAQWIHRYMFQGTKRYMGIGSADLISLTEAREIVLANRKLMLQGIDPLLARRDKQREQQKAETSFADVLEDFLTIHGRKWARTRIVDEWRNSLTKYVPKLMTTPIGLADTDCIVRELKPLWLANAKLGERLRARIQQVLSLAKTAGLVTGDNVAKRKGHLEHLLPHVERNGERSHHPAIAFKEIGSLMYKLKAQTNRRDQLPTVHLPDRNPQW